MPPSPSSSPPCLRTLSSSLLPSLHGKYPRLVACTVRSFFSAFSCSFPHENRRPRGKEENGRGRQGWSPLCGMTPVVFQVPSSRVPRHGAKGNGRPPSFPLLPLRRDSFGFPKALLLRLSHRHALPTTVFLRLSSSSSSFGVSHRLSPVAVLGSTRHRTTSAISSPASSPSWFFSWREARKRHLLLALLSFPFLLLMAALLLLLLPSKSCLSPTLLMIRVQLEGTLRVLRCAMVSAEILLDYQVFLWKMRFMRFFKEKKRATGSPTIHDRDTAALSHTSGAMGTTAEQTTAVPQPHQEEEEEDASLQVLWDEVHTRCAKRLVALAEANGGLYVKTGQIFANMSHVLPLIYCNVLASLQDKVQPRPFDEVLAVLMADLGGANAVESYLEYIDPIPLAAASLSQVHRARRRGLPSSPPPANRVTTTVVEHPTTTTTTSSSSASSTVSLPPSPWESEFTRDVVIKIQYIDIAARFRGDMLAINALLALAGWAYPGFNFSDIVRKLEDTVEAELDFRKEAVNSIRMGRELWKRGFKDSVICPTVHHDIQSSRVLVLNYINGVKINDPQGMQKLGIAPVRALGLFLDAVGYQVFVNGFFHADPHAGNILVRPMVHCGASCKGEEDEQQEEKTTTMAKRREWEDTPPPPAAATTRMEIKTKKTKKATVSPQVVLLDFGLCSELPEATRVALCRIWIAAITHNNEALKKMAHYYQLHSTVPNPHHSSSSSSSLSLTAKPIVATDADGSPSDTQYALFASCFLQYPYHLFPKHDKSVWRRFLSGGRAEGRGEKRGKGKDKEAAVRKVKKAIQRQIAHQMIEMQDIVTALPKEFALVLRSFLATRAINQELGVPINRHRIFFAYALEGVSSSRASSSSSEGCGKELDEFAGWGDGGSGSGRFWLYMKFYWSNMQNAVARFLLRFYMGSDLLDDALLLG